MGRRVRGPLRVVYAAGPGDVIGTHRHWRQGRPDPSELARTYSSQFFDACAAGPTRAYVVASHRRRGFLRDGDLRIRHAPVPFSDRGGLLYHVGQVAYGLYLTAVAIAFRAHLMVVGTSTHWFMLLPAAWLGIRVVPTLHCVLWPRLGATKRFQGRLLRLSRLLFRRRAFAIMSISPAATAQAARLAGGVLRPVRAFLPSYDENLFEKVGEPEVPPPLRALFIGRIERAKGVFSVLRAAQLLSDRGRDDVVFEFCGDGSALASLCEEASRLGLGDSVRFLGHCERPDLLERLSRCHVVVVPTAADFLEGFNKVVAEGVLAGRPVVASSVCPSNDCLREAVVEVAPDDVSGLCDALIRLRDDPDFYRAKRRACEAYRAQFFDPASSFRAALAEIMAAARAGRDPRPSRRSGS